MSAYNWLTVALSAAAVIVIPLLVLLFRAGLKTGTLATKLDTVVEQLEDIKEAIKDDAAAVDRRLRYIEEKMMRRRRQP